MKKNGLLFLLTIFAVGYVAYDFYSEKKNEERKAENSRLTSWPVDQVARIEVQDNVPGKDQKIPARIVLVKSVDGWNLEEPSKEVADSSAVSEFVEGVVTETYNSLVAKDEEVDWKVFGLDQPRGRVTLQNNAGEKVFFEISSLKNFQGEFYLRRNSEKAVYLVGSTWLNKIEKKEFDFQDRRLVRRSLAKVKELVFEQEGRASFQVDYQESKWISHAHPSWKLDQNKIREALALLTNSAVTEFVKKGAPTAAEKKAWGLVKPKVDLTVKLDDGSDIKMIFGQDPTKYNFVYTSDPLQVTKIATADALKFYNLNLDTLRDRKLPFGFAKNLIKKIKVSESDRWTEVEQESRGSLWNATHKSQEGLNLAPEMPGNLLNKLSTSEVGEFLSANENLQVKEKQKIVFMNEKDEVLFELSLGQTLVRNLQNREKKMVLVKSSLMDEAFLMDEILVHGLNADSFLKPAQANAPESGKTPNETSP